MDENIKKEIELEVRRTFAADAGAHRAYLEQLMTQLKWAASVVALVAGGVFVFFIGKTSSDQPSV
jgi:hypothetical protein